MLHQAPALPTAEHAALAELGRHLRAEGYSDRGVSMALGVLAWTPNAMDGDWWARDNMASGRLGTLIDLLIRGVAMPSGQAQAVLPMSAWQAGLVTETRGDARVDGVILPLGEDLIWTDRGDRSFGKGGLFLPDSTSLALRRSLPPKPVGRHLDLGSGGGTVTMLAARTAQQTVAMDLNPRAARAAQRSAALNGLPVAAWTGDATGALGLGSFDRLTFVLPLLVPWNDLPAVGPMHTFAPEPDLLIDVIGLLPQLLEPGGLALLYAQNWVEGADLGDVINAAFDERPCRAAFMWDEVGHYKAWTVRTGVIAVRADAGPGFTEARNARLREEHWWPQLERMLGG